MCVCARARARACVYIYIYMKVLISCETSLSSGRAVRVFTCSSPFERNTVTPVVYVSRFTDTSEKLPLRNGDAVILENLWLRACKMFQTFLRTLSLNNTTL